MVCYICQEELIGKFSPNPQGWSEPALACQKELSQREKTFSLICGHEFHIECISKIRKAECPVCRNKTIDIPHIEDILKREQQDLKRFDAERELSFLLTELQKIEDFIEYIEI